MTSHKRRRPLCVEKDEFIFSSAPYRIPMTKPTTQETLMPIYSVPFRALSIANIYSGHLLTAPFCFIPSLTLSENQLITSSSAPWTDMSIPTSLACEVIW